MHKLNRSNEAKKIFEGMLAQAQQDSGSDFFRQFEAGRSRDMQIAANHYLAGLAYEGMGFYEKAKAEFTNTLRFDPGHVWSKVHLDSLPD
jgi:tetratricopeptide (TPR) repeat protein